MISKFGKRLGSIDRLVFIPRRVSFGQWRTEASAKAPGPWTSDARIGIDEEKEEKGGPEKKKRWFTNRHHGDQSLGVGA